MTSSKLNDDVIESHKHNSHTVTRHTLQRKVDLLLLTSASVLNLYRAVSPQKSAAGPYLYPPPPIHTHTNTHDISITAPSPSAHQLIAAHCARAHAALSRLHAITADAPRAHVFSDLSTVKWPSSAERFAAAATNICMYTVYIAGLCAYTR